LAHSSLDEAQVRAFDAIEHLDVAPDVVALPGPYHQQPRAQPAGLQDPPREVGDPSVACPDRSRPIVPSERGQLHREAPCLGPGNLDAEANDLVIVSTADPIEQPDPRRDLGDVVLDTGDERGDDLVDPVEVPAQTGQGLAGRGRGDPEIQIDVGIDPHEQVLQDDRPEAALARRASSHDFVAAAPVW
jgi:hypothetical protein